MPFNLVAFGLILDDIVYPDGRTETGVLGGGGPQAAFGMRLWSQGVGLVAGVGPDLPPSVRAWLRACGIDNAGLRTSDLPTARAVQTLQADGRRTQTWRTPPAAIAAHLGRSLDRLPPTYRRARGFHLGVHPDDPDLDFIADLRRLGGVVSIETFKPADRRPGPESLHILLSAAHIFSSNLEEAQSLVGAGEPRGIARRIVEAGAWIVTLRMGAQGSLVVEGQTGRGARIPALPTSVVDPVGAGNAYSGGLLAGWVRHHDILAAGLYGAVAASFVVEQVGVPVADETVRAEARRRLAALRPLAEPFAL